MKTLIILNFVTRELWKFNFSKENFGKVLNFAEVEKLQTLPNLKKLKKVPNFAEFEEVKKVPTLQTLIILNFVTRELWKFNFSKENFGKENSGKENFGKV